MQISIIDPNAFNIYKQFVDVPDNQPEPDKNKPYIFKITELGLSEQTNRWQQVFAIEAVQDGDHVLSLAEAQVINSSYQSSHPCLRDVFFRLESDCSPKKDPEIDYAIKGTSLWSLENYADSLPGKGAGKDFLAAVVNYPALATLISPHCKTVPLWLMSRAFELKDAPQERTTFFNLIGQIAARQQFYEPIEFSLAKNCAGLPGIMDALFTASEFSLLQDSPDYQKQRENQIRLLELVKDNNSQVVADALLQIAQKKIFKPILLHKLAQPDNFEVYSATLKALAIWADQESVALLEQTIKHGSFQAQKMASASVREHFSAEQLAATVADLLEDDDPCIRGAGLKILQFAWARADFAKYAGYFIVKSQTIAEQDDNLFVRMAAIECLGYSRTDDLIAWLDSLPFEPELAPFIDQARNNYHGQVSAEGRDNPNDSLTDTFLYPGQNKWIIKGLRKLARQGEKPLKVLMVGCSYGLEALSLLIDIVNDYKANPEAWGNFEPLKDLKIIVSDIDNQVLLYAQRGRFHFAGGQLDNEFEGMRFYYGVHKKDFKKDFDHFFESARDEGTAPDQFRLRDKYANMLEFRYLDILEKPSIAQANIVTFNKLDYHWKNNANATFGIVHNVFELASNYTAYVTWDNPWTSVAFKLLGVPVNESGPMGFYKKSNPAVKQ